MRRRWGRRSAVLALVVLALVAPLIAPQDPADPLGFDPAAANVPPSLSWTYLLGADARGRSVLALLLWGSRVTLAIGVGAALLAAALGVAAGPAVVAGAAAWLDAVVSRLMELCQAAPPLLVLLLLAARLGGTPAPVMLAVFALTGWVAPARLTRATVLAGWRAPYVDAARAARRERAAPARRSTCSPPWSRRSPPGSPLAPRPTSRWRRASTSWGWASPRRPRAGAPR